MPAGKWKHPFTAEMERYFEYLEIESDYLEILLSRTVRKIIHSGFGQNLSFGSVIEGNTIAGGIAELTVDHCIRINSRQLNQLDEDVAMALIAHELAHDHLKHFQHWKNHLENEYHADNLAREWGFDIDRFRRICGPPRLNSRLLQIAVINEIRIIKDFTDRHERLPRADMRQPLISGTPY